jgi:hypothetical protein
MKSFASAILVASVIMLRAAVAAAEVPSVIIHAPGDPDEHRWDFKLAREEATTRANHHRRARTLITLGGIFSGVFHSAVLIGGIDRARNPHSPALALGAGLGSIVGVPGAVLLAAGIPLFVLGDQPVEMPRRPPLVYATVGPRSAGLALSF